MVMTNNKHLSIDTYSRVFILDFLSLSLDIFVSYFRIRFLPTLLRTMISSVRVLRLYSLTKTPPILASNVSATKRSYLTDGANVIGSNPDRNSPDFKVK
jgi:hypothetical protein